MSEQYLSFLNNWYSELDDIKDVMNIDKLSIDDFDDKFYIPLKKIMISGKPYLIDEFGTIWSHDYEIIGINKKLFV